MRCIYVGPAWQDSVASLTRTRAHAAILFVLSRLSLLPNLCSRGAGRVKAVLGSSITLLATVAHAIGHLSVASFGSLHGVDHNTWLMKEPTCWPCKFTQAHCNLHSRSYTGWEFTGGARMGIPYSENVTRTPLIFWTRLVGSMASLASNQCRSQHWHVDMQLHVRLARLNFSNDSSTGTHHEAKPKSAQRLMRKLSQSPEHPHPASDIRLKSG